MADNLTKLDAPALRAFIDHDVHQFRTDITTVRTTTPEVQSLYDVGAMPKPLAIGALAEDTDVGGKNLVDRVVKAAKAIDAVFNKHATAFDDLERNLNNVITTMLKTQGENLSAVDGQKFLTAIGDYDGDMGGSSSSQPPTS
jgi:Mg-chelatase subunit ChlI